MSGNSFRLNDQMRLPGIGVPIDPWTRQLLPDVAIARLEKLKEAEKTFRLVLHELDGSSEGTRPGDRRMTNAFTNLEQAMMWAAAAVLDH